MTKPGIASHTLWRVLIALCVVGFALLLANAGCSSGAICYRNTDCPVDFGCDHGQCVRHGTVASDADVAVDPTADSQTPDAN